MVRGKFIVIDGIDGCGKSTMVKLLSEELSKKGTVYTTMEPTEGPIGAVLRNFLKDKDVPKYVDSLLFAADRLWHIHKQILPALEQYDYVISDRYVCSSIAYQSVQNGNNPEIIDEWVKDLNKHAIKSDHYIILDVSPEVSLTRREKNDDKFENVAFLTAVRNLFLKVDEMNRYTFNYKIIPSTTETETFNEVKMYLEQNF